MLLFPRKKLTAERQRVLSQGTNPVLILYTFPFSTEKWERAPTYYNITNSNSQVIFHTPTLSTNTNTQSDKIKTWTTPDVTPGSGKYSQ